MSTARSGLLHHAITRKVISLSSESTLFLDHPTGGYRFVPTPAAPRIVGAPPFASTVLAMDGYQIVRATFEHPLPLAKGFETAGRYLESIGRPKAALCATEIRVPRPLNMDEFGEMNVIYRAGLTSLGVPVGEHIPAARSNAALHQSSSSVSVLLGFSYTVPSDDSRPAFVLSAVPEHADVRPGETTADALRDKAFSAIGILDNGFSRLQLPWTAATDIGIYTHHDVNAFLGTVMLPAMGTTAVHGIHWYFGAPPIAGIEIEIDARATYHHIRLEP